MTTPRRFGIGLLLVVLGLLAFCLEAPSMALAQDAQDAPTGAAQSVEDTAPEPPGD